jgi:hypothetical protein
LVAELEVCVADPEAPQEGSEVSSEVAGVAVPEAAVDVDGEGGAPLAAAVCLPVEGADSHQVFGPGLLRLFEERLDDFVEGHSSK